MVEEDDEDHEPLEPGEWVEQPEQKPVVGPVLSVAERGALPSLEDLIKPRQDVSSQQRVFPLPRPTRQQKRATAEGASSALCCQTVACLSYLLLDL